MLFEILPFEQASDSTMRKAAQQIFKGATADLGGQAGTKTQAHIDQADWDGDIGLLAATLQVGDADTHQARTGALSGTLLSIKGVKQL